MNSSYSRQYSYGAPWNVYGQIHNKNVYLSVRTRCQTRQSRSVNANCDFYKQVENTKNTADPQQMQILNLDRIQEA